MPFDTTLTMDNGIATITLSGQLDATAAPSFRREVERAAGQGPRRLVLLMEDLDYMASAGLRGLVFAKQKMGPSVEMFVVGAQPQVMNVIQMTGFDRSVIALDAYDPAAIE